MRLIGVLAACICMSAAVAWGSVRSIEPIAGPPHPRAATARRALSRSRPRRSHRTLRKLLWSHNAAADTTASVAPGVAQAFPFTDRTAGSARTVSIYVAPGTRARRLTVGLYSDDSGRPGALVALGKLQRPTPGGWRRLRIGAASLLAGHAYWLAVLGTGGRFYFRAERASGCTSQTSSQRDLLSLPDRWRSGATKPPCRLSAHISALPSARVSSVASRPGNPTQSKAPTSSAPTDPSGPPAPSASGPGGTSGSGGSGGALGSGGSGGALGSGGTGGTSTSPLPAPPAPAAPTDVGLPSINGTATQGNVLSASRGSWSVDPSPADPASYAYQWQRCDASGGSCSDIPGAMTSSYGLQPGDVGDAIRVVVTATDAGGSTSTASPATSVVSAAGGVLAGDTSLAPTGDSNDAGAAQAFSYTATTSGTATAISLFVNAGTTATQLLVGLYSDASGKPGELLASGSVSSPRAAAWNDASVGSATITAGTAYWIALLANGGQIDYPDTAGGSGTSYVDTDASLTALPSTYAPGTVYDVSPASAYVAGTVNATPSPPTAIATPTVAGQTIEGQTLATATGSWSNSPTSYSYTWEDCNTSGAACTEISGATSSAYTLQAADVGDTVRAVVTATNTGGSASASSAATGTIASNSQTSPSGPQIYIAQSTNGTGSGADCADAKAASWFNTNSNWGTTTGKIGPDVTVDLCGTISTALVPQGSGTNGNPVTVYWEAGATLSSPDWNAGAAINTSGQTYLTFNGGDNGVSIQATAEGSGLADQGVASQGFYAMNCTGCTFENLTIANLYQHTSPSDTSVDQTMDNAIEFSGSNVTIADNTIHDVGWALYSRWTTGQSNDTIYGNDISRMDHGFAATASGTNIGPMFFYDNHVHDMANWDAELSGGGFPYHHDGLHCYGPLGGPAPTYNGFYIYDNRFDGAVGDEAPTAQIFMEGGTGTETTPCASSTSTIDIFDNVVTSSDYDTTNAYINAAAIAGGVYNNTVIGASNTDSIGGCTVYGYEQSGGSIAFENNLLSSCDNLISQAGNPSSGDPNGVFRSGSPDFNVYANGGVNSFVCATKGGAMNFYAFSQLSAWQSCLENDTGSTAPSWDQHSRTVASAQLAGDGSLESGSPAVGAGTNLTSLCTGDLAPLCTSYTGPPAGGGAGSSAIGTSRPSSGPWNAGAY